MAEEFAGIGRVRVAEDNGGCGHGGGSFSGEIRPGIVRVNPVSVTVSSHVLRPLPTVVVSVPVSYLNVKKPQQQHSLFIIN